MAINEIKTAEEVIGIMLGMELKEFDKLKFILLYQNGFRTIRNQVECRKKISEGMQNLGRI